ncbi:DUF1833 family protein [Pseudomonas sp.]|uniref:DUF1833 family protein n=1 Tax=Pseudomonas sp. TaxID=306 RepID=UPI003F2E2672
MPDSTLSQALREAYAAAPSNVAIYHTLELNHAAFNQPIYVVNDWTDLNARLETGADVTFLRFAFRLTKPEVTPTGIPQLTVEIDNVSRDILANVQLAMGSTAPITMTFREYLSSDLTAPQNDPPMTMELSNIKADVFKVSAVASFGDYLDRRFPGEEYTAERFPGLVVS